MLDQATDRLYSLTRDQARRGLFWSTLTRRSRCLLALDELEATFGAQRDAGVQMVAIRQIRGTESRSSDFDRDFNPLHEHTRRRWLNVAAARRRGKALPPVKLIQVGAVYFVRDGHHRVSVARALGQRSIEARVVVWEAAK